MAHLHKARFLSCPKNSMRADEVESEVERRGIKINGKIITVNKSYTISPNIVVMLPWVTSRINFPTN